MELLAREFTAAELAERVGLHVQTVRKLIRSGELRAARLGSRGAVVVAWADWVRYRESRVLPKSRARVTGGELLDDYLRRRGRTR